MTISTQFAPNFVGVPFADVPNDSRRIVYASLTSSDSLGDNLVGAVTDAGGDITYSSNGVGNGGAAVIKWTPSAAEIAALNITAHIHLEVESSFMSSTPSGPERLLTLGGGGHKLFRSTNNNTFNQLDGAGTTAWQVLTDYASRPNSHTLIDVVIAGSKMKTYIDGMLMYDEVRGAASNFATINLFSAQDGTTDIWGKLGGGNHRVKNFYVTTGYGSQIHHPNLSNVHIYGDSITQQGNLPAGYPLSNGIAGDASKDIAMTSAIIKKIASKGISPNVLNHAVAGDTLADVTALIAATTHLAGCAVCVNIGINNAKTGVLTPSWQTDYEALIVSIRALGADHIFIWTLASTAEDSAEPEATSRPAVNEANAIVKVIADANSDVTMVDIASISGFGVDYNLAYYKTNELHLVQEGERVIGEFIGDKLTEHYGK